MFNPFLRDAECNIVDNEVIIDKEREKMIAWAAGLYEGEGTTDRGHPVRISQKDTWILYKMQSLFGGNIVSFKIDGVIYYNWSLAGESGRKMLKLFIPYLSPWRIKQINDNGVLDVLKMENTCNKGHEFTAYNTKWLTSGNRTCRICYRKKLKELKRAKYATI